MALGLPNSLKRRQFGDGQTIYEMASGIATFATRFGSCFQPTEDTTFNRIDRSGVPAPVPSRHRSSARREIVIPSAARDLLFLFAL